MRGAVVTVLLSVVSCVKESLIGESVVDEVLFARGRCPRKFVSIICDRSFAGL